MHARVQFAEVFDVITKMTNRFTLRHDYMPYDYAICLYKDNAINRDALIFDAHNNLLQDLKDKWRQGRS